MNLNSKDIIGALFCCVFLILGLSFWEPGLSYSNYPPLPEAETSPSTQTEETEQTNQTNLTDQTTALIALELDAASPQTTYGRNSEGSGDNSISLALALRETDPKDLDIEVKEPAKTETGPVKAASPAGKPAAKKTDPTPVTRNKTQTQTVQGSRVGELIAWSKASRIFALYDRALITDVDSGLSFWVERRGGSKHADCQPRTAADTAIMKKIYGEQWNWERKAIVVTVDGRHLAASMNGMPHMAGAIKNNNFDGHFCIHFLDSRTHGTNRLDTAHQSMVRKAGGQ